MFVLVILLIIYWIVDAGDWDPVVDSSSVDAGCQGALGHCEVSSSDQGLGSVVVLGASIAEELPDLLGA